MARNFVCPYTGSVMDFDSIPGHGSQNHLPGKWSVCGQPYDDIALGNVDYTILASPAGQADMKATYTKAVADIKKQISQG